MDYIERGLLIGGMRELCGECTSFVFRGLEWIGCGDIGE